MATPAFDLEKYPGVLNYKIKAANFLSRTGAFRVMPLPRYDLLLRTGALPVAGKRTTPYWRNHADRLALRYTITPPPGFAALQGRKEKVQIGKYGSAQFTETCSALSGQLSKSFAKQIPQFLTLNSQFLICTSVQQTGI